MAPLQSTREFLSRTKSVAALLISASYEVRALAEKYQYGIVPDGGLTDADPQTGDLGDFVDHPGLSAAKITAFYSALSTLLGDEVITDAVKAAIYGVTQ